MSDRWREVRRSGRGMSISLTIHYIILTGHVDYHEPISLAVRGKLIYTADTEPPHDGGEDRRLKIG